MKEYCTSKTMMYRLRSYTLCSLPQEVLIHLFKFLPLRDLINTRQVCSQFKWLIDGTPHLWTTATLVDEWPNSVNIKHFKRAASVDNVEALIKLGIACLYNEGYPESFDDDTNVKGQHAADYLCRAERLLKGNDPFLWALIRPPWSKNGACCKATVFNLLKELAINSQECDKTVFYCIARITIILQGDNETGGDEVHMSEEVKMWLTRAAQAGSHKAMLQLWQYNEKHNQDAASKLDRIRQLREITASQESKVAKMELFESYAKGNFGGLPEHQAAEATRTYIQESRAVDCQNIFNVQSKLNNAMRYILVDWLVEVAGMKGYSSHTLHMVISCIDRYLMHQPISRGNLQLVGITAMVICSRLLEPDIITIREAAWLTDGTYQYETVVRMMGDMLATLRGKIDVPSLWEYLMLYCKLAGADRQLKYLALYISELSLLHLDFGRYSLALQAASIFYLARIIAKRDCPWPAKLVDYTGYQPMDLASCTLHIHKKCFSEEPLLDHRNMKLSAVKQRYEEEPFLEVSKVEVLDHATLRSQVCLSDDDLAREDRICSLPGTPTPCGRVEPFLMSPSRSSRANRPQEEAKHDREDLVTTPTGELSANAHEMSYQEAKNDSFMSLESGYDADMESDAEGDLAMDMVPSEHFQWEMPAFDNCLSSSPPSNCCEYTPAPTSADRTSHLRFHRSQDQAGSFAHFSSSAIPVATANLRPQGMKLSQPSTSASSIPRNASSTSSRGSATAPVDTQQSLNGSCEFKNSRAPSDRRSATRTSSSYTGQSFQIDKNGKLRPRSPRIPLKRLENSHSRKRSKRKYSNGRDVNPANQIENSHLLM